MEKASLVHRVKRKVKSLLQARAQRSELPEFVRSESRIALQENVVFQRNSGEAVIGAGVTIYRNSELHAPLRIGEHTFLNRDCFVRPHCKIGRNVSIGAFSRLLTDNHEIGDAIRRAGKHRFDPITIGDGVWIGASCTILGGVEIGDGAIVAAGSLVTENVAPNTLVAGVPAKHKRDLPEKVQPALSSNEPKPDLSSALATSE